MSVLLMILLFIVAVFLIILVLIQRGKGGGLAGAFGGMGGQSAFGTKAGDLFTRITIGVAAFWILLCVVSVSVLGHTGNRLTVGEGGGSAATPSDTTGTPDSGSSGGESAPSSDAGAPEGDQPSEESSK